MKAECSNDFVFGTNLLWFSHFLSPPKKLIMWTAKKHESGLELRHRAKQAVKLVLTVIGPKAPFRSVSIVIFMWFFSALPFCSRSGSWIYVGFYDLMFRKQFPVFLRTPFLLYPQGLFKSDKGLRRQFWKRCQSDINSECCQKENCKKDFAKQIATQSILRRTIWSLSLVLFYSQIYFAT